MTILIADDSDFIRANLKKLLNTVTGVDEISEAFDVPDAVKKIAELKPDILILDIRMPGGNGFDVLKTAKEGKPSPLTIMLTNYNYEHYRKKSYKDGADYFFDKSTEFEKIIDVLEKYHDNDLVK